MRGQTAFAATLTVSGAALASRVLGLVRDALLAATLGAGPVADAFLIAFRIPNLARRALAEGALTAGFAPLYARARAEAGEAEAARLAGEALSGLALLLCLLVALGTLGAGGLVFAIAAGLQEDGARAFAADLTRITLPAILWFGLSGLLSAVLAARARVVALSLAPLATNATLIGALLLAPARTADPEPLAAVLALAVTASGLVQLAIVAVAAARARAIVFARPRLGPRMRRALALGAPALVTVASVELIFLAATQVASFTPGAVARLYYAERVLQLPLGLVAAAAAAVLLPRIAAVHRAGDAAGFVAAQNRALAFAAALALPATTALLLLDTRIVTVLFGRGAFAGEDVAATAAILSGLAIGLPFAAAAKILQQGAFARERVAPGLLATLAGIATTLVSGWPLTATLGPLGLGLSVAAGLAAQAVLLGASARSGEGWRPDRRLADRLARTLLACAVMAAVLVGADRSGLLEPVLVAGGETGALAVLCLAGAAAYAAAAIGTGAVRRDDVAGAGDR